MYVCMHACIGLVVMSLDLDEVFSAILNDKFVCMYCVYVCMYVHFCVCTCFQLY